MRLFVAADLPAPIRAQLAGHGRALAGAGGWRAVAEESLHVTLAFLGEVPQDRVDAVRAAVAAGAGKVGEVALDGSVHLPPRRPRVAAVDVRDPRGRLAAVQRDVVAALVSAGVHERESRRFRAHVTVARRTGGASGSVPEPDWEPEAFAVPSISLYASRLSPRGARYEAMAAFPA